MMQLFFLFKQKTAYEMRISDWSSDVCSSDLRSQATPVTTVTQEDIVITGSRIRHNPLDQDAPRVFVDQQDIQKTGLNSVTDVLQRLPRAGGGLNAKFNNSGNFGNPPDGGGVGAGAAEIDLEPEKRRVGKE